MSVLVDMASVLSSALRGTSGIYASAPITSGRRRSSVGRRLQISDPEFHRLVIEPNVTESRAFVARLQKKYGYRVIDPSRLPLFADWEQDHYYALWGEVVRNRTEAAAFLDGWEYSRGCTFEFAAAVASNVPTFDAHLKPLGRTKGIDLMRNAAKYLSDAGEDTSGIHARLDDLGTARFPHIEVDALQTSGQRRSHLCAIMLGCVLAPHGALMVCPGSTEAQFSNGVTGVYRHIFALTGNRMAHSFGVVWPDAFNPATWSESQLIQLWEETLTKYCQALIIGDGCLRNPICRLVERIALSHNIAIHRFPESVQMRPPSVCDSH